MDNGSFEFGGVEPKFLSTAAAALAATFALLAIAIGLDL